MTNSTGFTALFSTTMVARVLLTLATRRHFGKVWAVGIVSFLAITSFAWAAGETKGSETSDKKDKYSAHDYTVLVRPTAWLVFVEGKYETSGPRGESLSLKFDGDLDYDDPYPTFSGETSFRWGRHDFSIIGMHFDESEDAPINASFTIGGKDFDIGGVADSKTTLTDINLRYGYSFFEFEEDGFRLGPTIAVSYTTFSVALSELFGQSSVARLAASRASLVCFSRMSSRLVPMASMASWMLRSRRSSLIGVGWSSTWRRVWTSLFMLRPAPFCTTRSAADWRPRESPPASCPASRAATSRSARLPSVFSNAAAIASTTSGPVRILP